MITLEVRIPKHKLDHLQHSVHIGNYTMRALRDAGIPVQGALSVIWVDDGELTVRVCDDELVYTWRGETPLITAQHVEEIAEEIW